MLLWLVRPREPVEQAYVIRRQAPQHRLDRILRTWGLAAEIDGRERSAETGLRDELIADPVREAPPGRFKLVDDLVDVPVDDPRGASQVLQGREPEGRRQASLGDP